MEDLDKKSGFGTVQVESSDLTNDPIYSKSLRALGESIFFEGFPIRVTTSGSIGDTISITQKDSSASLKP